MLIVNKAREAAACSQANCASSFTNATNAATSATNAANSATAAAASETNVENLWEDFQERYMGPYATPPVAISEGSLYYNTTSNVLFVWNGTVWTSTDFNEFTNFTATGTTTARNLVTRFADVVNVLDFGADPTGAVDSQPAIQAALTFVKNQGGGKVIVPDGTYKISNEISITPTSTGYGSGFTNLTLEGSGYNTVFNFSSAIAGSNGISIVGWAGRLEISRIVILNSKNIGIDVNSNTTGSQYISRINIHDVIIQSSTSHGMRLRNTYMGSFSDIESRSNGGDGFNIDGFSTSLIFTRCWAGGDNLVGGNQGHGWYVNNIVYSSFISCASDWNSFNGFKIKNANGVNFTNCGAESNIQDGFYILNISDTDRTNATVKDVKSVSLDGCFAFDNCKNSGTYSTSFSNLARIQAFDNLPLQISLRNCYAMSNDPAHKAVEFNGNSGRITIHECLNSYNNGSRIVTGNVVPIIFENNNDGNFSGNVGVGKIPANFGLNWSTVHNYGSEGGVFRSESSSAIFDAFAASASGGQAVVKTATNHPLSLQTNNISRINIGTTGQTTIFTDITLAGVTTATTATAGTNGDVPAQVAGYLQVSINGTNRKIPFYAI